MIAGPVRTFRDPVHGDIQIPQGLLCELIDHPDFQRLRRIRQLGCCYSTFHGAEHSRFQHTLGVGWLALQVLQRWEVGPEEAAATLAACLLHDVGHGPFSHALEHVFTAVDHEAIGHELIRTRFRLVLERHGIDPEAVVGILRGTHPRRLLHELISGQLDVDRMDYLQRDSLYTGTRYGLFDGQRILGSLTPIYDLELGCEVLALDSGAVEAVEAFFFSRYFMHWQVYFHRTVRATEFLLRAVLQRARQLGQESSRELRFPAELSFLFRDEGMTPGFLQSFVCSDDADVLQAIKRWQSSPDPVLSDLSQRFLGRRLPKVLVISEPEQAEAAVDLVKKRFPEVHYYVGVDRPSDLALQDHKAPVRVLTGRGRQWCHLAEVTRTGALQALSQRVSENFLMVPPECRDEVEKLLQ